MNNIKIISKKSEETILTFKKQDILTQSVSIAVERTGSTAFNPKNLIKDVLDEFKDVNINLITEAIKKGSLGAYGRTYKMSTQEVCIWIREYLKTNKVSSTQWAENPYKNS